MNQQWIGPMIHVGMDEFEILPEVGTETHLRWIIWVMGEIVFNEQFHKVFHANPQKFENSMETEWFMQDDAIVNVSFCIRCKETNKLLQITPGCKEAEAYE